jgi:hypothetical protein
MEDATNYLNNLDKPKERKRFLLRLSYAELWAIVGLAQNPHEAMQDNPQVMEQAEAIFNTGKAILDRAHRGND